MKKITFIITGILSLVVVMLGFVVTFLHNYLVSLLFIAAGGICFWWGLRIARKEEWFGKSVK
jgi:Flp pilus assembly protein TadB